MNFDSSSRPPFVHWPLDRWKLAILLLLFTLLLVWVLLWPEGASTAGNELRY